DAGADADALGGPDQGLGLRGELPGAGSAGAGGIGPGHLPARLPVLAAGPRPRPARDLPADRRARRLGGGRLAAAGRLPGWARPLPRRGRGAGRGPGPARAGAGGMRAPRRGPAHGGAAVRRRAERVVGGDPLCAHACAGTRERGVDGGGGATGAVGRAEARGADRARRARARLSLARGRGTRRRCRGQPAQAPLAAGSAASRSWLWSRARYRYMAGSTNRVNAVPMVMPEAITMPSEKRAAAPGPLAISSGIIANTRAAVVISTGRRRMPEACSIASRLPIPCICSLLANSTIRMPCLEITPTRVTRPTWV